MKLNILSDLHLDINKDFPFNLELKDIFTIICGDISENVSETCKWIKNNISSGVFVEGNHIGYQNNKPIQEILENLSTDFPLNNNISHLNNSYKIIEDIVFVGGILWTDFELYGKANKFIAMKISQKNIKDFMCTHYNKNLNHKKINQILSPKDAIDLFHTTLSFIKNVSEKFSDKKIVVITHHAPSLKSIPEMYKDDLCSTAFANNLDDFILTHPNIKLWCHGHIHHSYDYYIGNCRIICNPRGYISDMEDTEFVKEKIIEI